MEVSVEIIRSSDFKQVYAIGAIGGHSPYDFRIAFYNDSPKAIVEGGKSMTVMERKIETEMILSPLAGAIKPGQASESAAIQGYM
jgi:outer membrane lipoprotein-sorting protein